MADREGETWMGGPRADFTTTLWTVVVQAKDAASPERRAALEKLIEKYWKPLYLYVRRRGQDSETAKDTVQSFFTTLLEKDLLQYLQPGRSKFRTFLLLALKHHMSDRRDHDTAVKRGGGKQVFALDFSGAEKDAVEQAATESSPEQVFRREWGFRVLEQALEALRAEYVSLGREKEFEEIRIHLGAGSVKKRSYTELAAALGLSESELNNRIHRARGRLRELVLQTIRSYTEGEEQVQDELRDLFSALS